MSQIIDIHGRPLRAETLKEPQTARLAGLHSEFAEHPVRNLTPHRLARILQDAEEGQLKGQAELFQDMEERDGHIFSEISKRKRAVIGLDWTVDPARNATAQEKADAEFLHELLLDLDNVEDLMLDMLDGIGHGYSCIELQWQRYGKEWQPQAFHHRPQSWFITENTNQNKLLLRTNHGEPEELRPFNWIVHTPKARSGYIARTGLYRVLAWPYLFKHYSTRDLAELLEVYGMPIRLGMYPAGTAEKEKATLLNAVTQLGHSAAGIIPESMKIEFQAAAQGNADPFLAMMEQCDASISKAVLGGTLTSQTSSGGGGSYALGKVHNEVRHDLLESDARQLAATLTKDLLWPLIVLNRGGDLNNRRMPRFSFDLKQTEDLSTFATALPPLVNIGMQIPKTWVHDKLGIPQSDAHEEVLAPVNVAMLNQQPPKLAALNSILAAVYPDQSALDHTLNNLPATQKQQQLDGILAPLLSAIEQGQDEHAVLGLLAEAFPELDESALTEALHKALFAVDAFARLQGGV
ncbi:DUF935 domain-containing protein [Pseudomonas sp. F1_0610]|uniref:DUF935 domain-containing protein n=1 Tax=Pseudomonas sp. F1_0610 TaxID=3114284 RepID=UPI0039C4DC09